MNCQCCARPLSDPTSLSEGRGPKCRNSNKSREVQVKSFSDIAAFKAYAAKHLSEKNEDVGGARSKLLITFGGKIYMIKTDVLDPKIEMNFDDGDCVIAGVEAYVEADMEFTCNRVADILGLSVARYGRVQIGDHRYFMTEMFTNNLKNQKNPPKVLSEMIHIRRMIGANPEFSAIYSAVTRASTTPELCAKNLVHTVLYDSIVLNTDRHCLNLAMLKIGSTTVLSPTFDNMSSILAASNEKDVSRGLNRMEKDGQRMTFNQILSECHRVNPVATRSFCDRVVGRRSSIEAAIAKGLKEDEKSLKLMQKHVANQIAIIEAFYKSK